MSKKSMAPLRIAPLRRIIARPITDPAEQAALDKLRKRRKRTPENAVSNLAAKKRGLAGH
jgi:hypothetical protein